MSLPQNIGIILAIQVICLSIIRTFTRGIALCPLPYMTFQDIILFYVTPFSSIMISGSDPVPLAILTVTQSALAAVMDAPITAFTHEACN